MAASRAWLDYYNVERTHTALGGITSRIRLSNPSPSDGVRLGVERYVNHAGFSSMN